MSLGGYSGKPNWYLLANNLLSKLWGGVAFE